MSEFKEIVFWIGDDKKLSKQVQNILFGVGYRWGLDGDDAINTHGTIIHAHSDGCLGFDCQPITYLERLSSEEIDIDWMRKPKQEEEEPMADMSKEEALKKIAELQKFVEDLDKPKRVRVYIKEDTTNENIGDYVLCQRIVGKVCDVRSIDGIDGIAVYENDENDEHIDYWYVSFDSFIVVEGSLEDLKS